MKKGISIIIVLAVIFGTLMCFSGCGNSSDTDCSDGSCTDDGIKIEDIIWSVDTYGSDDYGREQVFLSLKNNTSYTLYDIDFSFCEKDDITEDEKNEFLSYAKEHYFISDDYLKELKDKPFALHANVKKVIEPGDNITDAEVCYYSGKESLYNIDFYELVKPDTATIKYIDDGKIFTLHYDFSSNSYSVDDETITAIQWSETDFGNKISKPETKVVEVLTDTEDRFTFNAYGLSPEQFKAYVEEIKQLGYTDSANEGEGYYRAYLSAESCFIDLDYYENNRTMCVVFCFYGNED